MSGSYQSRQQPRGLAYRLQRYPLLFLCLSAAAGTIAADRLPYVVIAVVWCLSLILLITQLRHAACRTVVLACLIASSAYGWRHHSIIQQSLNFPLAQALSEGQEIRISGLGWFTSEPKPYDSGFSGHLEIVAFETSGHSFEHRHRVPVWVDHPGRVVAYGELWRFTGTLVPFEKPRAPGAFDPATFYFRALGSVGQLNIHHGDELQPTGEFRGSRLVAHAWKLRRVMETILRRGVSQEDQIYADVIAAMSLGARESTPEDIEEHFRLSGTLHLFAVSGLHVAVVGALLLGGAHLLRIPKRRAALALIPLILYYAVLTGLSPSAVRSSIMFALILGAYVIKEQSHLLNNLGLAGLILIAWDTHTLFMPGFQLSFVVVLSIAIFTRPLRDLILARLAPDPLIPRSFLPRWRTWLDHAAYQFSSALAISLVSWVGSIVLLIWHFHHVSFIGIFANLIMVPLSSLIIILSAISLSLSGLGLGILSLLANRLNVLCTIAFTWLAQHFAGLPASHLNVNWFTKDAPRPIVAPHLSQISSTPLLQLDIMGERGEQAVLARFFNDAGTQQSWLLDTGGRFTLQRQLLPALAHQGINHVNGVILSHGDSRHIGGAPYLIARFRPHLLVQSEQPYHTPIYPAIVAAAQRHDVNLATVSQGDTLRWNHNTQLSVLAPALPATGRIADDRCLVLMLKCGEWRILFTHDSGFLTEHLLMELGKDLTADVWIRGQHAEQPSGQDSFIQAVHPQLVISSHANFPAHERVITEFLKELENRKIPILNQQESGLISIDIFPEGTLVTPYANRELALFLTKD